MDLKSQQFATLDNRYRRNVKMLEQCGVNLRFDPASIASVRTSLVFGKNKSVPINLNLGGQLVYPIPADEFSRHNVGIFFESSSPGNPVITMATADDLELHSVCGQMDKQLPRPLMTYPSKAFFFPKDYAASLYVFGLGLGFQIHELLNRYRGFELFLVETETPMIIAFLFTQDLEAITKKATRKGFRLHWIFYPDPTQCGQAFINAAHHAPPPSVIGYRLYSELQVGRLADAMKVAEAMAATLGMSYGYFNDERRQIVQTAKNLEDDPRFLYPSYEIFEDVSAVVVGAGPSLNHSIDLIRELQERAVVISCGTGLQPLLSAGIVPDLHVELETHQFTLHVLNTISEKDVFERVPLACSAGIDPNALKIFKSRALFLRDVSASSMMFGGAVPTVQHTNPRAGNAGAAVAAFLGFGSIYLMGIDCGYQEGEADHAAASFYDKPAAEEIIHGSLEGIHHLAEEDRRQLADPRSLATLRVPGVTGASISLDSSFMYSLSSLVSLQNSLKGQKLYQVGYGAMINGATNLIPADVKIESIPNRRQKGLDLIANAARSDKTIREIYRGNMETCASGSARHFAKLAACFERPEEDYFRFIRTLCTMIDKELIICSNFAELLNGGLAFGNTMNFSRMLIERLFMCEDGPERTAFLSAAAKALVAMYGEMTLALSRDFLKKNDLAAES